MFRSQALRTAWHGAQIAQRFASRLADRFAGIAWRAGEYGSPILHLDSLANAECKTVQEIAAGDHVVLITRVGAGSPPPPGSRPLIYFRYNAWPGTVDDARVAVHLAGNGRSRARAASG